jgi:hypothetical protein
MQAPAHHTGAWHADARVPAHLCTGKPRMSAKPRPARTSSRTPSSTGPSVGSGNWSLVTLCSWVRRSMPERRTPWGRGMSARAERAARRYGGATGADTKGGPAGGNGGGTGPLRQLAGCGPRAPRQCTRARACPCARLHGGVQLRHVGGRQHRDPVVAAAVLGRVPRLGAHHLRERLHGAHPGRAAVAGRRRRWRLPSSPQPLGAEGGATRARRVRGRAPSPRAHLVAFSSTVVPAAASVMAESLQAPRWPPGTRAPRGMARRVAPAQRFDLYVYSQVAGTRDC